MALTAMVAAFVQHIRTDQILLDLFQRGSCATIVLVMHGIQHQYMSTDDKQQCVDQCFHGMPANEGRVAILRYP